MKNKVLIIKFIVKAKSREETKIKKIERDGMTKDPEELQVNI
jgi:hypothetical protein